MHFITNTDYRALPRVSNSDLTRLKEEHLGYDSDQSARESNGGAKVFGRAFHQHLSKPTSVGAVMQQLLPDMLPATPTPDRTALLPLIQQDQFCRRYWQRSERDRVVLWRDPHTDVACKARMDMVYTSPQRNNALIIDIKPTLATTRAEFLASCYTNEYDRQAAFSLDSLRHADGGEWADTQRFRFVFVGVQPEEPNRLFAIDATSIPGFVDYGRKKYRFWLRKWRDENAVVDEQRALLMPYRQTA